MPLVVSAEHCHPKGDADWWDYEHHHFGGNDGIEFVKVERLLPLFDRNMRATHVNMHLTKTDTALSPMTR